MDFSEPSLCPKVEAAFALLSKRWAGLILYALRSGELRFSELEEAVPGLSSRLLSLRVKELEEEGLVLRRVEASSPVKVGYRLTRKGEGLADILDEVAAWARG
jgi:DNA-binding HxlR family transcriptional regulator